MGQLPHEIGVLQGERHPDPEAVLAVLMRALHQGVVEPTRSGGSVDLLQNREHLHDLAIGIILCQLLERHSEESTAPLHVFFGEAPLGPSRERDLDIRFAAFLLDEEDAQILRARPLRPFSTHLNLLSSHVV